MLSAQPQLPLLTQHAAEGQDLTAPEIEQALHDLLETSVPLEAKAEFLVCLAQKGETPNEIADFAIQLRDLAIDPQIDLGVLGGNLLDTCGTGADGANTFNVSTATAFLLAAAGIPVAKHGNRGISSKCGSADVLEALGVRIEIPPSRLRESIESLKIGFLFAPQYHKTFSAIQPVREHLAKQGQRTIFNLLGPLVNPARPNMQVIGVRDPMLTEMYAQVASLMKLKRALVAHGYGPDKTPCMDELSTVGPTKVTQLHSNGKIETFELDATTFHFKRAALADLSGGDPATNARIIRHLLAGEDVGPRRDFLVFNASVGFVLAGHARDLDEGVLQAQEVLKSGAALKCLDAYRDFSRQ